MTPTLAICLIAAAVAAVGLFLPKLTPLAAPSNAYAAPAAGGAAPAEGAAAAPAEAPANPVVRIADFSFSGDLTVTVGQTVTVTNVDGAPHTVTANDGSFDTGDIGGGGTGSFVAPTQPGTYDFICTIHPSMTGQLVVLP